VTARLGILVAVAALAAAAPAQARTAAAAKDGRPNILVVMTDDQALADVQHMPNVRKLLAARGTTFADAIDSYPLCCPARATFITGQYAHNHDVRGNFNPYGWYGMKDRGNTLPAWLQKAGYRTALVGKWLNGYGARDAHGEVPKGFDIWRGLLDVSAYDYSNFVMNRDGKLETWGDPDFARKLVEFADIQVFPQENPGLGNVFRRLREVFGDPPYSYWGTADPDDYSPDVTGGVTNDLVTAERRSKKPFFIWWSVAAPHREDVATTLMGRPGRDPRPPQRYEKKSGDYKLPRPPSFNEPDIDDKPSNVQDGAPELSERTIEQLQLDYEGRIGSLLAVDDHVKKLVDTLKRTGQLDNTLIVFLSDNGWLQGEHRVPGDKFLPYEESVRVPFILRGPGVPAGRVVRGQVANVDFAPTLVDAANARSGRTMDGVSLLPGLRDSRRRPDRAIGLEALTRLLGPGDFGPFNAWDRPYTGVRTDRYTYARYTETGEQELYDRRRDPHQLRNVAAEPRYADVLRDMRAKLAKLRKCRGSRACDVAQ
jgi:N-acetylglucosamine-6-sulfatase